MALVLSLHAGEDFYVDDTRVVVEEIVSDTKFVLSVDGKRHEIVDDAAREIAPKIWVSVGDKPKMTTPSKKAPLLIRAAIDAPRDKLILRGPNYRAMHDDKKEAL